MRRGGCLCGGIRYEVTGELGRSVFCHCQRCRKASGSVVAFNAPLAAKDFKVVSGAELLKSYTAETGLSRLFCANCGSQVISRRETAPEVVRLRLGTLDEPTQHGPEAHIFFEAKLPWFELAGDEAPRFPAMPSPEFLRPAR
jgi:hypothetical protein